ncbi:primary-amine oxidase [Sulfolobus tengchongensis]|uniref:Amine oxidase n=1 Tax=Sulfolobus tengchongensis TaxID=207809 RepID=A0AAX4L5W5_9CREN
MVEEELKVPLKSPLDPLDEEEIKRVVELIKSHLGSKSKIVKFFSVSLDEPKKQEYLAWKKDRNIKIDRRALIKFYDPEEQKVYEGIISLTTNKIISLTRIDDVFPPITLDEFGECEKAVRNDRKVQEALRKRGILPDDLNLLMVDCWAPGYIEEEFRGKRVAIGYMWIKKDYEDNGYGRPVHGLMPWVDLDKMKVIRVDDYGDASLPHLDANYTPEKLGKTFGGNLKTLEIRQPRGASFRVNGWEISWYRWKMRIGYTPREGLVIYDVTYTDENNQERTILYRASVVDLMVPYGDPSPFHNRKMVLDAGDYGLGNFIVPLKHGMGDVYDCDCFGEIIYHFDVVRVSSDGKPVKVKKAICVHEEDFNILWRHTDLRSGKSEVRRNRRLVISFWATLANYDYGFFWYFYQDGSIEFLVKLTGIINDDGVIEKNPKYGTLVTPEVYAPLHIHWFNIRLNLNIDGLENRIYEVNLKGEPVSENNPVGNAFFAEETLLENEIEARRHVNPQTGRYWKIVNIYKRNYLGLPVGYRLIPVENVACPLPDDSYVRKRGGYINYHLWVTPYDESEKYATGDYPYEQAGEGLPKYVLKKRSIVDKDLVVWYTLGVPHVVRVEDWPVMPVEMAGFWLKPDGFFNRNPSIDLPRQLENNKRQLTMEHHHQ